MFARQKASHFLVVQELGQKLVRDLRLQRLLALCIGLVGFTIFEVGAAAATPVWVTLTLFGLNHFVELQSELARQLAEEEARPPADQSKPT